MQEHHALQSQYDHETNYSRNPAQQNAWKVKIEDLLSALQEFSDYR
jgi:hypothetical protein